MFLRLRGYFLAGLLVAVPLGVTAWVLLKLVELADRVMQLLPAAWQPEAVLGTPLPGLGVVLVLSLVMLLGLVAQTFIGRQVVSAYEALLLRVPLLSSLYNGIKQLMEQLFSSNQGGFQRVVLVQWPRPGAWSLAFVTGESFVAVRGERLVNLFLPTTPNPTTGFYFQVPESELVHTELSVEEGFKLLMSAGIVAPADLVVELAEHGHG